MLLWGAIAALGIEKSKLARLNQWDPSAGPGRGGDGLQTWLLDVSGCPNQAPKNSYLQSLGVFFGEHQLNRSTSFIDLSGVCSLRLGDELN